MSRSITHGTLPDPGGRAHRRGVQRATPAARVCGARTVRVCAAGLSGTCSAHITPPPLPVRAWPRRAAVVARVRGTRDAIRERDGRGAATTRTLSRSSSQQQGAAACARDVGAAATGVALVTRLAAATTDSVCDVTVVALRVSAAEVAGKARSKRSRAHPR